MNRAMLTCAGLWWLYGIVGTYVLGTQVRGRQLTWGVRGLLLGPAGMLAALIIPAVQGRIPQTTRAHWTAFGLTMGLVVVSEVLVCVEGGQSAIFQAFMRY